MAMGGSVWDVDVVVVSTLRTEALGCSSEPEELRLLVELELVEFLLEALGALVFCFFVV